MGSFLIFGGLFFISGGMTLMACEAKNQSVHKECQRKIRNL